MAQAGTQSNAMRYALITFVALFLVGAVCAVIFYIKSEEYRNQMEANKSDLSKIVNTREQGALAKIVGRTESGQTYLGTLNNHFNKLASCVTGTVPNEDISADVKMNDIIIQINDLNKALGDDVSTAIGPESVSLINQIKDLKAGLDEIRTQNKEMETQKQQLQDDMKKMVEANAEKERQLIEQVKKYEDSSNQTQTQYGDLEQQRKDVEEERVQAITQRLEQEQARLRSKQMELNLAQEELTKIQNSLKEAIEKLDSIRPRPSQDVTAYQPDAAIMRVDLTNKLVYLNIGSENHVYHGLTFAVYDRNLPIPEDGTSKAELEVFQVEPKVSVARIVKSSVKNPVVLNDLVVNLIWDSKTSNRFVVIGEFDLDNDGIKDADGNRRVREMIERWGGIIEKEITINTDFVVAGLAPRALPKPDQDELDVDPTLQEKYDESVAAEKAYDAQLAKASVLCVPVFNQKRFLYLIGNETILGVNASK